MDTVDTDADWERDRRRVREDVARAGGTTVEGGVEGAPADGTPLLDRAVADGAVVGVAVQDGAGSDGVVLDGPLAREFSALTAALLDAGSVADVLKRVVAAATTVIPAAELVSVTLRGPDGTFSTPVETHPIAHELDRAQYRSGTGPCVDSAREDGPSLALSDDLAGETRWREFAEAAYRHGYRSVLATSLLPDARPPRLPGALNLYARDPHAFTEADRVRTLLLATHASLALATAATLDAAALKETQLRTAIESRDLIGQAKGILMARRGLTADEAFDVLRRTSQDLNVKLVELAGTVAARHSALDISGS